MTAGQKRAVLRVLVASSVLAAYMLGRSDGDRLSAAAFLVAAVLVAGLCVVFYELGWQHRRDHENAVEAERQIFRDAATRNRRSERGATLVTHALAVAVVLLAVLWGSFTFGSGAGLDPSGTTAPAVAVDGGGR